MTSDGTTFVRPTAPPVARVGVYPALSTRYGWEVNSYDCF